MAARKKTDRKKTRSGGRARAAIDEALRDLEKRLPRNMRGSVRDLRGNIKALQKQADRLREERDERWRKLETQVRGDIVKLLQRLEKAVAPRKKSSTRKKKTARKRAPSRKKNTRKKTTRRKTARS